ncbi:MAG: hypothetical protein LBR25_04145 [Erysipelotrichaceae bacterium]|nr:hypothetical protein [Erysipelotrichaceae bacterium]
MNWKNCWHWNRIIPILFTLFGFWLASRLSLWNNNFSDLSTTSYRVWYWLWGFGFCILYAYCLNRYQSKMDWGWRVLGTLGLLAYLISILLPYSPSALTTSSNLHVQLAISGNVITIIVLLKTISFHFDPKWQRQKTALLLCLVALCLCLIMSFQRTNSFTQWLFTSALVWLFWK